jgi:hypothetical protein
MKLIRMTILGFLTLLIIVFFARQIVYQLRSGKVRFRGSKVDQTRHENPGPYWLGIGVEVAMIGLVIYLFSLNLLKAAK